METHPPRLRVLQKRGCVWCFVPEDGNDIGWVLCETNEHSDPADDDPICRVVGTENCFQVIAQEGVATIGLIEDLDVAKRVAERICLHDTSRSRRRKQRNTS